MLRDAWNTFFGDNGATESANKAASAIRSGNNRALSETRRQFNATRKGFQPFLSAGRGAFNNAVRDGSSFDGLDRRLGRVLNGQNFENLMEEREATVIDQLARGGLTRSGAAIEAVADIPTDLAFAIEEMLYGRKRDIANMGLNAAAQVGAAGTQTGRSIADLYQSSGQANSNAILQGQQARSQGVQNFLDTVLTGTAIYNMGDN